MKYIILSEKGAMFFSEIEGQLCYSQSSPLPSIASSEGFLRTYEPCRTYSIEEVESHITASNEYRKSKGFKLFDYQVFPILID